MQWGTANTNNYKYFPLPFSEIYSYTTTRRHDTPTFSNGTGAVGATSAVVNLTGITTYVREADGGQFRSNFPVHYLVIGK